LVFRPGTALFPNENEAPFCKMHHFVLQNHCDLQRFQNAIPDLRKVEFCNGKTTFSASRELRCENIVFSNENEVLFRDITGKVLRIYCILQCFQNAIPDLRKIEFSHWKS